MKNSSKFKRIKDFISKEKIEYIALLSIDIKGRLHTLTLPSESFNESFVNGGVGFDASSYGFAPIENSDMVLIPDLEKYFVDPFKEKKTLNFLPTVHYTDEKRTRYEGDPRFIAEKAENILKNFDIADYSLWAPEFEFFLFENIDFGINDGDNYIYIEPGEYSHEKSYHIAPPEDRYFWFRDNTVSILQNLGIRIKYHHHEVGKWGQQEIETKFEKLLETADNAVIIKYILKNYANINNLALTFMPKPLKNQAGNGWHLHQYLVKNKNNAFYEKDRYGNLNKTALFYIGGILYHINSLISFTNPSTNSFKRLVPGFEAPTGINFGLANRNSAIRIPGYVNNPQKTRMEFRTPDATANPYLCLSAVLMAGIDGIINKIDPIEKGYGPAEPNSDKEFKEIEADPFKILENLEQNGKYLFRKNVFEKSLIDKFIKLKHKEYIEIAKSPTPPEFIYYFNI